MYEDEFELTFDTPEEEPVYVPEPKAPPKPKAAPVPPAPEEPTRIMEMSGDAAPAPSRRKHRHLPCRQQPMAAVC